MQYLSGKAISNITKYLRTRKSIRCPVYKVGYQIHDPGSNPSCPRRIVEYSELSGVAKEDLHSVYIYSNDKRKTLSPLN